MTKQTKLAKVDSFLPYITQKLIIQTRFHIYTSLNIISPYSAIQILTSFQTKSNTSTQVLNLLNSKLASDTTVVTSVVSGTELVITAVVSGTTFSLEGQSSNNATFIFGEPKMLQAPRVVTITGTPTIGVDDKFDTATITPTTYQFNLYAIEGYSHNDIAKELNISTGTSKSQLARARKMLKKLVKEQLNIG